MTRPDVSVEDRYELVEQIGTGASAEVWRARDRQAQIDVAVKRFHGSLAADAESRARFADEATAASRVRHPNVVGVIDRVVSEDELCLIFPYVAGGTLVERIANGPLLEAHEAARICVEIADALAAVHAAGLVHRDVKPGNILLGADGRARLLDFGIAKAVTDDVARQSGLTGAGLAVGTLPYMAPEQLAAHAPSPPGDVYGLGAVLYELLAGRRPYEATAPVPLAEAQRTAPPPIDAAPRALNDLALAALAYDLEARPSAAQFARAARGWLDGRTEPAAPTTAVPAAAATAPVSSPPHRLVAAAIAGSVALAVLVVAVVGPAWVAGPQDGPSSVPQAAAETDRGSATEPGVAPAARDGNGSADADRDRRPADRQGEDGDEDASKGKAKGHDKGREKGHHGPPPGRGGDDDGERGDD